MNSYFFQRPSWIAFCSIARENIRRFLNVWGQAIMPPVITTALYFIVFGQFVGKHIPDIHGYSYMQFILPGLVMMSVIMSSFQNSAFAYFVTKLHRNNQDYAAAPISNQVIMLGFISAGIVRAFVVGCLVSVTSLFFTQFMPLHPFIIFSSAALAALLFSLLGFTSALLADSFDQINIIPTFALTPLIYLGGVFYSIQQLPSLWQNISMLNPIFYIIETFRYGFLGFSDLSILFSFLMLIVFNVILYSFNLHLMNKGTGIRVA